MVWYKKALSKFKKELITSAILAMIVSLLLLIAHYNFGKTFEWTNLEVLSAPTFFDRVLYSAMTYVSVGAFLYFIRVYQLIYFIFITLLGAFRLHKMFKQLLWWGLMLAMYFWIVPKTIEVVNAILSFFYNIAVYLIYLTPRFIGSFVVISMIFILFQKYKTRIIHGLHKR